MTDIAAEVLTVIQQYTSPDNRCTKRMIANVLHLPYANTHSNGTDRAIRDACSMMVLDEIDTHPICATSDTPGYFYAQTREDAAHCIADLYSRGNVLIRKARNLERYFDRKEAMEEALERGRVGSVKQLELV
jgi:hypothetical protein